MTGGYKIIDMGGMNIKNPGSVQIPGVYESIESTNKALLITGLVIDQVECNEVFACPNVSGSNYVINIYGKTITIKDDDTVSVS